MKQLHLIVTLSDDADTTDLTDSLGEHMRLLELDEDAGQRHGTVLGLVPDASDPGRYAWRFETRATVERGPA